MPKYVGAIDQGTTSTRFMVFNYEGSVICSHQLEHDQIYPSPGWVEHDPVQIWRNTRSVMVEALKAGQLSPIDIVAIGITNQRETTVVWDKDSGQPLHNAIVWQDTRTDQICIELAKNGGQDRFREKVGLPLATYFSGPKIKWLLDNVDGLRRKAERGDALFGNIDTWLIWNLTGGPEGGAHLTDVTNASRTMLMDLETMKWDGKILKTLGIPRTMLPEIRPSSDPNLYGTALLDQTHVLLCGDLGDQQAALFGQTCFSPGEVKNTYGTGCFMLLNTGTKIVPSASGLLTTLGYKIGADAATYALEGSIAITGALVQWLRDNLGLIESSSEVESLAKSVRDNGGVYFVPAFSGLFAPHWRSDARGVIVGLTRYVNKGHIARASLEATAYQTREVLEAMQTDAGVDLKALKVDGGMIVNELLMQFQADILGLPVIRPTVNQTTALGAAYAAGLAVGFWNGEDELRANWGIEKTWHPEMEKAMGDHLFSQWKKAVERSLGWIE